MPSLWSATASPAAPRPQLVGTVRAPVVIVGAGYTGLSAAVHLAQEGREALVLEAAEVGERASGSNGGQVIPGLKYDPDVLEELFGPQLGPQVVTTVAAGPDLVFDLIRKYAISCQAVRNGWLQPANSPGALAAICTRVQQWHRRGAPVQLLSREQTARLIGSDYYLGGWIDRRGGSVQPLSYVRGLADAAERLGVRIFARSNVTRLSRVGYEWLLSTARGEVLAPVVILATNAYSGRLFDPIRRSVVAVPSFQVATAPLPDAVRRGVLPEGQCASDTCRLLRYFRLDESGRLLMGTRGSFTDAPIQKAARHHYRAVKEIFPQLEAMRFEYHWGGLVAMTRDHLPHLHEPAAGLMAGLGYNGRGVAMATMMGRLLARRALGEPAEQLGFPVTPVQPIALHRFSRFGARSTIQWLRMLDGLSRMHERARRARRPR